MPELPEVETTKQSLQPLLTQTVEDIYTSDFCLRRPIPDLSVLIGATLRTVQRRAKYLLLDFDKQNQTHTLLIHLGMSGSLGQYPTAQYRKHDHVIFSFEGRHLHYYDPRRFGMIVWQQEAHRYLDHLGVEPLSEAFCGALLWAYIHKNPKKPLTRPIKSIIMDQTIVVGVGNIYAAESLFLSRIHPATPACLVRLDALECLAFYIKQTLQRAIAVGGTTLKDFVVGDNQTGYFQQTLLVYGRAGLDCVQCNTKLHQIKIAGRASVFCPNCQPVIP